MCGRADKVKEALVSASPATACADVTGLHVRDITTLDLSGQSITTLSKGDFDGLYRLDMLDLSDNSLTSLPAGLFDELYSLTTLRLHDNDISSLPVDIFDQLFLLETLTLHDNELEALPDGMFDDLSRFEGVHLQENTRGLDRLTAFIDKHSITSVESLIEALPDLHKERFVMVYNSGGLGSEHISPANPRFVSWGPNGEYVFAWMTNLDAPDKFKHSVEFLIPGSTGWTAGIVDFSGDEPEIAQPTSCQTCHGAQNKPLFPSFDWAGTEYRHGGIDSDVKAEWLQALIASTNPRITPMKLELPEVAYDYAQRVLHPSLGNIGYEFTGEEASKNLALRHAEVLFGRLKERNDYAEFAEDAVCDRHPSYAVQQPFRESREHSPGLFAHVAKTVGEGPGSEVLSAFSWERYHFRTGSLNGALLFLVLHDLWNNHAAVRALYRATTNTDATSPDSHYTSANNERILLHPPVK